MGIIKTFKNFFLLEEKIAFFSFVNVENEDDLTSVTKMLESLRKYNEKYLKNFFIFVVHFTRNEYEEFLFRNQNYEFVDRFIPLLGSFEYTNQIISYCFKKLIKKNFDRYVYFSKDLFFIDKIDNLIMETKGKEFTCLVNKVYEGIHVFEKDVKEIPDNVKEYNRFKNNFLSNDIIIIKDSTTSRELMDKLYEYKIFDRFVIDNRDKINVLIRLGYILDDVCLMERILADNKQIKVINPFVYKIWAEKASFTDLICINMKNHKNRSIMINHCNDHFYSCLDQREIVDDLIKEYERLGLD